MAHLKDQVAIVTGGSSGIGLAVARTALSESGSSTSRRSPSSKKSWSGGAARSIKKGDGDEDA